MTQDELISKSKYLSKVVHAGCSKQTNHARDEFISKRVGILYTSSWRMRQVITTTNAMDIGEAMRLGICADAKKKKGTGKKGKGGQGDEDMRKSAVATTAVAAMQLGYRELIKSKENKYHDMQNKKKKEQSRTDKRSR